jgi:hypothetical protein
MPVRFDQAVQDFASIFQGHVAPVISASAFAVVALHLLRDPFNLGTLANLRRHALSLLFVVSTVRQCGTRTRSRRRW